MTLYQYGPIQRSRCFVLFLHIVSFYLSNNLSSDGLKVTGENILYLENKNSTLYVLQRQLEYVPVL